MIQLIWVSGPRSSTFCHNYPISVQRKRPSWNSGFVFFSFGRKSQSSPHHACVTFWLWRMRDVWLMSTWHGVMADEEKLSRCKISTDTVYNTFKTYTRYAQIVRGRTTLKDVERFRNGSVREPYERSLYEQTFMSEPSRNMLYQLSYLMLIERSIDRNLIMHVNVIVNQTEYQFEVWKVKEEQQKG